VPRVLSPSPLTPPARRLPPRTAAAASGVRSGAGACVGRRRAAEAGVAGGREASAPGRWPGRDPALLSGLISRLPPGFSLGSPGRFGAARRPRDAGCL
jgi:hypothetical protein